MNINRINTSINKKYIIELDIKKQKYIEFLKKQDMSKNTFENYKNQMYKIRTLELILDKNKTIEKFSVDKIILLLKMMQVSSKGSAIAYRDRILDYFKFCISEFKINYDISSLNLLTTNSFIDTIINKTKNHKKYVTEGLFYEETFKLINAQDRAIIRLIYEGIKGINNKNLIELKKLNYNKNTKILDYVEYATGELKHIKCNEFLAEDIEQTILQPIYYFKNGQAKGKHTQGELTKTEYLLEPNPQFYINLKQPTPKDDKLLGRTIQRRGLDILKKYLMLNGGHVTVESLYQSGLINKAVKESVCNKMDKSNFVQFIINNSNLGKQSGYRLFSIYDKMYEEFKNDIIIE